MDCYGKNKSLEKLFLIDNPITNLSANIIVEGIKKFWKKNKIDFQ